MTRPITLILSIAFILFRNISIAQDELTEMLARDSKRDTKAYFIKSLEGQKRKIVIMPDYVNHNLAINCLKDTVWIEPFWGVPPEVHILGSNFIRVDYAVRGGSNLGLGNTMILCVSHNKLCVALHILRYSKWEDGRAYMYYGVKMSLSADNKYGYRLKTSIKDTVSEKETPSDNYSYKDISVLNFDSGRKIFYSVKKPVSGFILFNAQGDSKHKEFVRGYFPIILLGSETYYFIKDKWYQTKDNFELSEFE
jgi:hypothetical protein